MSAGKTGVLFLVEAPMVQSMSGPGEPPVLQMFDLKTRKTEKIRDSVNGFILSANGEKMLYRQGQQCFIAAAGRAPAGPPAAGAAGPLHLDTMEVWWIRAPSGSRCITKCGASSAISSTIRATTASNRGSDRKEIRAVCRKHLQPRRLELSVRGDAGRNDGRPHVCRAAATSRTSSASKAGCSARTTRSKTAATASRDVYNGENWNPQPEGAADAAGRQR